MGKKAVTDKQRRNSEAGGDGKSRRLANLKPFKPGESGNPAGRPKSITLSEALRLELAKLYPGDEEKTNAEHIAALLVEKAADGDLLAAKEVADRTEGRPRQALDVDMNVLDWRALARQHGLNEADVFAEARRILEESAAVGGGTPGH